MFNYFRFHRRGASASTASSSQSPPTQQIRPASSATIGSDSSSNPSTVPPSPITKSIAFTRPPASRRFSAKQDDGGEVPDVDQENPSSALPVSSLPPILPPIPRIAETIEEEGLGKLDTVILRDKEKNPIQQFSALPSVNTNPLRLNAVTKGETVSTSRPTLQTQNLSTISEQPCANLPSNITSADHIQNGAEGQDRRTPPVSLAYQLDFGQGFMLDDGSLLGQADSRDESKSSTKASSPTSSKLRDPMQLPQQNTTEQETTPFTNSTTDRNASPTSSYSSFQKPTSSTNLAIEVSPLSQSPVSTRAASSFPAAPPVIIKSSKPRRSLLNPVSLLMRRKTANSADLLTDVGLANKQLGTATSVPENYDPRIKGKGVHDFNVPRPRRNYSTNDLDGAMVSKGDASPVDEYKRRESVPWAPPHFEITESSGLQKERSHEREHTPVFFENFEDDAGSTGDDAAIHRETLANQSFLARVAENVDLHNAASPNIQKSSTKLEEEETALQQPDRSTLPTILVPPDQSKDFNPLSNDIEPNPTIQVFLENKLSVSTNPETASRLLTPREHRTSNASRSSRFSFQFADERSAAQEHALEERHKQKAAQKALETMATSNDLSSSDDSEDDSIAFDDDDDLHIEVEEAVPGVNADDEDFVDHNSKHAHASLEGIQPNGYSDLSTDLRPTSATWSIGVEKLPISSVHGSLTSQVDARQTQTALEPNHDDELYFDDGLIEASTTNESRTFDESIFDSPTLSPRDGQFLNQKRRNGEASIREDDDTIQNLPSINRVGHDEVALGILPGEKTAQPTGKNLNGSPLELQAYHSALASAATEAHAAGYFERDSVEDVPLTGNRAREGSQDLAESSGGQIPINSDSQVFFNWDEGSATPTDWPGYDDVQDNGAFDEDEYEDDQMIAAANAEALAADVSGFYGREFNFYGNGKSGTEFYSGGFFRDPSKDGVGRTTSLRDPTLTPITERSEFSRAPSYMSLNTFGNINATTMAPPLPSPGLKELAARFGLDHDDMTLKQLMKLRKETFSGGTAGSSGSSPSSFSSSPLLMKSPPALATQASTSAPTLAREGQEGVDGNSDVSSVHDGNEHAVYGQDSAHWDRLDSSSTSPISPGVPEMDRAWPVNASRSGHSPNYSTDSAASGFVTNDSAAAAPTSPTQAASPMPMPSAQLMHKFAARPPASSATYAEREAEKRQSLPLQPKLGKAGAGAGLGIGSDSVAYVREDDQWFMERRRTMGNGEVMVLTRELVEGGRI